MSGRGGFGGRGRGDFGGRGKRENAYLFANNNKNRNSVNRNNSNA